MKKLYKMENKIQKYDWGTYNFISELLDVKKKKDTPWAELWMSAHDKAPSFLPEIDTYLNSAISKNPREFLGEDVASNFNNKLPFLFKILSAEKPLSIQAHPNLEQAKKGFKRENLQGIKVTDFLRNYKDDNHKPELICALTEFHAMCGFRPATEIIDFFTKLKIATLFNNYPIFEQDPSPRNWKAVFEEILKTNMEKKLQIIETVIKNLHLLKDEFIRGWISKMTVSYPNDIGVISPLFLNTFILKPGEAVYLNAGVLHAYLCGSGVEIMANSDNVLRGGLTSKNIDVKELVSILQWNLGKPEIQSYNQNQEDINYNVQTNEFCLRRINLDGNLNLDIGKPGMTIIIEGKIEISCGNERQVLTKGESLFITSEAASIQLSGKALLFIASTNCR